VNERIRQLAIEAKLIASEPNGFDQNNLSKAQQKFAELIVRECAGLFPNVCVEIETDYGHTPVIASDYIKQHFGVEE
jgi:hypothetical protein